MLFRQRHRHISLAAVSVYGKAHTVPGGVGIELGIQGIHIRHGAAVGGENNIPDAQACGLGLPTWTSVTYSPLGIR